MLVAGWYGNNFKAQLVQLNALAPDIPAEHYVLPQIGSFWFESPEVMYPRLRNWLKTTAPRVFKEKNRALANLMQWALPSAPETLAAMWYTQCTHQEQSDEIDLQMKIYARGMKVKTRAVLIALHETLIRSYLKT